MCLVSRPWQKTFLQVFEIQNTFLTVFQIHFNEKYFFFLRYYFYIVIEKLFLKMKVTTNVKVFFRFYEFRKKITLYNEIIYKTVLGQFT